ncbi:MAG: phenylacetate--CoA ligase family protein [Saprospiraceae bacterium]|nr:phenylacetate--CoA ligase family protein [Saprospiraceae bacterium]
MDKAFFKIEKNTILHLFQIAPYPLKVMVASINGLKLNYWRNHRREKLLRSIEEKDGWSASQIADWQQQSLEQMLRHAAKTVPYYRNWWENHSGMDPADFMNWPILEKSVVKANPDAFISDLYRNAKLYQINTSGTSGSPMSYRFDREALSLWYAMYEHRIKRWNGVSGRDRWANIGGQLICAAEQSKPPFWVWNVAMKQLYLSSYHITASNIRSYLQAIKKHRITYLLGYVSSIYNIAKEGLEQGLVFPQLKLVITNAEPLFDHQRELISEAFSCPVIQTYSGCEYAFGGNEDLTQTMYLWPEAGIMEVVDENGRPLPPGKTGNFIVTGLVNKAMPLIRYRIGDSGALAPPNQKNSRNFSSLLEITGRNDDLVYTVDGKLVGRLDPVFKGNFNIKEAQIIQERLDFIRVLVAPLPSYTREEGDEIVRRLQERVGTQTAVHIELTEAIPRSSNGKFNAVVSKIKHRNTHA